MVMSYPHFFDASPEYLQGFSGLSPNPALHQTQADVEPVCMLIILKQFMCPFRQNYVHVQN
jgi:hypothetical protein